MPETITVAADHLRLSLILWRRHGRAGLSLIEATLDLNPDLADLGPIIPFGTTIVLPDLPASNAPLARQPVSLFGA